MNDSLQRERKREREREREKCAMDCDSLSGQL